MDHASWDRRVSDSGEPGRDVGARLRELRIPDPEFPAKVHSGRRSSRPVRSSVPGGQPDPRRRVGKSSAKQLRWARGPDDGRLHLLQPADVALAAARGQAPALCGYRIPVQGLTITRVPPGAQSSGAQASGAQASALCMACVIGAAAPR